MADLLRLPGTAEIPDLRNWALEEIKYLLTKKLQQIEEELQYRDGRFNASLNTLQGQEHETYEQTEEQFYHPDWQFEGYYQPYDENYEYDEKSNYEKFTDEQPEEEPYYQNYD